MYKVSWFEVCPDGYDDCEENFNSFTEAVKFYRELTSNPFVCAFVSREKPGTMMYLK